MKVLCDNCARELGLRESLTIGLSSRECVRCGSFTQWQYLRPVSDEAFAGAVRTGEHLFEVARAVTAKH